MKPITIPVNKVKTIKVSGLSLNYTDKIYLSAGSDVLGVDPPTIEIFSNIPSLSADFPGFKGIPISYNIYSENIVHVTIPSLLASGSADLIILNRAGYDRLDPTYTGIDEWTDYNLQNKIITIE